MALDYHYFNLHKKCWSVMNRGKVIAHVEERYIENPVFVVRPAGQRKVRETGRKNVHAFVKGIGWAPVDAFLDGAVGWASFRSAKNWIEVSYNPYRTLCGQPLDPAPFYVKSTGAPVYEAMEAVLTSDRKLFVRF